MLKLQANHRSLSWRRQCRRHHWLIALAFPPLAPWWLIVVGTLFAIVVAKHLYGGLGQNPFNPAMIAFAVCIVSFPSLMAQWPPVELKAGMGDQLALIFGQMPRLDAMSGATPSVMR